MKNYIFACARRFAVILFISPSLWAFTTELISFSEQSLLRENPFQRIDSEYDADILSYSPRLSERLNSLRGVNLLDSHVGSISSNQFYRRQKMQFQKDLNPQHRILFSQHLREDYDTSQDFYLMEWAYRPAGTAWEYGLFGEIAFEKKNNDLGILLRYYSASGARHSFRFARPDYSRNKRNDLQDRYKRDLDPKLFTYRFEKYSQVYDVVSDFYVLTPTAWQFPEQDRLYRHRQGGYSYLLRRDHGIWFYHAALNLEYLNTTSSALDESSATERERYLGDLRIDFDLSRVPHFFQRFGLYEVYRGYAENRVRATQLVHNIYMEKDLGLWSYPSWVLRYTSSQHRAYGSRDILDDPNAGRNRSRTRWENKADLEYRLVKRDDFQWEFTLTFDLDEFGGEGTWEGGHSRLTMNF